MTTDKTQEKIDELWRDVQNTKLSQDEIRDNFLAIENEFKRMKEILKRGIADSGKSWHEL